MKTTKTREYRYDGYTLYARREDANYAEFLVRITTKPSLTTRERWMMDGVAKATDGCRVEPDGECPHGAKSWLIVLGYI